MWWTLFSTSSLSGWYLQVKTDCFLFKLENFFEKKRFLSCFFKMIFSNESKVNEIIKKFFHSKKQSYDPNLIMSITRVFRTWSPCCFCILCYTITWNYKQLKSFGNNLAPRKWDSESLIVERLLCIMTHLPVGLA